MATWSASRVGAKIVVVTTQLRHVTPPTSGKGPSRGVSGISGTSLVYSLTGDHKLPEELALKALPL